MSRSALALGFAAGIAVGFSLTWLLIDSPEPLSPRAQSSAIASPRPDPRNQSPAPERIEVDPSCPSFAWAASAADVERAASKLDQERNKVTGLKRRLDALFAAAEADPDTGMQGLSFLDTCRAALQQVRAEEAPPRMLDPLRPADESFDSHELVETGFSHDDLDDIRIYWENAKLAKLELADKLARGETPHPGENFAEIERRLREDLGDDNYGAMLYSSNQQNAVALYNVLESSSAYEAGLRDGRLIYSYDGQRVFKPMELNALIQQTEPGETVAVEFEHRGELLRVFVDSGLIGASYKSTRFPPTKP